MEYINFGNRGLILSRLTMGAMTFGQGQLVGELKSNIDLSKADHMVNLCLDRGINSFDTADMYTHGQSEEILGKILKGKRDGVILSTKCGFRSEAPVISSGLSYRYIIEAIQKSLKRMDTDYIDIFHLHIPDPNTPLEESAKALEDAIQKGFIRYGALSNFPAWKAQKLLSFQERTNSSPIIGLQMYYSLLGRDIENEIVPFLQANQLSLMVWSPLASGYLTGKYSKDGAQRRRDLFDFPPIDLSLGEQVVSLLFKLSEKYEKTPGQISLAWLLSKPWVSSIILGANDIHQLEENIDSIHLHLSHEDLLALDELTKKPIPYPQWMEPMGNDIKVSEGLKASRLSP